ncbi:IS110 family transposase [Sphingomonas sp. LaA6.9]|uniref:IS110 family transposase n=1 Tax=Sphingomonas sp. LaA6.9 TaxID=2919914 RepID=UPI001F5020A8|nr:IS110 family transposase [Sphingomonas sp. LaA6.9]MCJ8159111.1 IS110 family transposase [Sphingomonas sp. LaA6.9]
MEHYAGLDVSLEQTSVCVVDAQGQVVCEAKVASEPEALIYFLCRQDLEIARVGLEAGPLSQWLHAGLVTAGFEAVLLETRHVKAALSAMTVKTDRRDARGIAQLLRLGWYRPVHAKSVSAQEVRSLLTARKLIQGKLLDIESGIRGVLRGFGLKVGTISRGRFEARILELVAGQAMLETVARSMLAARGALQTEFARLHRSLLGLVRADPVCQQLMSVPGVGAIVAITFRSGVDNPARFLRSRDVGPHFGLTPRKYQSGELDVTGSISKVGDRMVRTALYEAANVMLTRTVRMSALKSWALAVAKRRGAKKARVALARKLGVILHRMWVDGSDFRWTSEATVMA